MADLFLTLLKLSIFFGRNTIGCINRPYITYRKLSEERTDVRQTIYIFILAVSYFAFASLLRTGVRNPYLLTVKFNSLLLGGCFGFLASVFLLLVLGRLLGYKGSFKTLFILWAYSLLPTLVWFFLTSFAYLILPPPRTLSIWGKMYSVLFIAFSIALLSWKIILYFLTLRFGLRFGIGKIISISTVLAPFFIAYSVLMYRLGIFRIPFI